MSSWSYIGVAIALKGIRRTAKEGLKLCIRIGLGLGLGLRLQLRSGQRSGLQSGLRLGLGEKFL